MRTALLATLSFLTLAATGVPSVSAQNFSSGDLYIVSAALKSGGVHTAGISRTDPFTGTPVFVRKIYNFFSNPVFDPYRGRLIVYSAPTLTDPAGLWAYDANGTAVLLSSSSSLNGYNYLAVGTNGRIYLSNAANKVMYLDAGNTLNNLLDSTGTTQFTFSTPPVTGGHGLYYDSATHSLLTTWIGTNVCGSGLAASPYVGRISLQANETQVTGAETSATLCVSLAGSDAGDVFEPNTFGPGPNGSVFLTLDNNAYIQCGRMVTINPLTLAVSTFATTSTYFGCPAADGGCYSSALNRGFILDTFNNILRAFTPGSVGAGTSFASGDLISSDLGSAEKTYILEIPFGAFTGLTNYGVGTPGCEGAQVMSANTAPVANVPNFYLTTTLCPPSSLGLILASDVPDVSGADWLNVGLVIHLDLLNSTQLIALDGVSNALGFGASNLPIPLDSSLIGQTFYTQSIWLWSGCNTGNPLNLSASNALALTIQP